ncbi:DNA repair protein RAD51 homolog 4 isoform X2 [Protopterus annectens]|uniref:DNA repair protein RAD51 homolog 4 isoform X2 n=1 Tax=Protopterus annectens TaxID=7888 RepID=UPI001CFACA90|nr:DNA repair protein RAD51 homolog 4 isoform X2 [Protopterus annectens]
MVFLREGLCPGLTSDVMRALKAQHIRTVLDLVASDIEELAQQSSISYKTLVAVRRVLLAQYSAFPSNGADLYEELMNSTAILSTGNKNLDKLLDSGLYTGELTELTGGPGSGKTQLCLGVAVNVSYELKQNVLYIDSSGGFTASRLLQMVKSRTDCIEDQMDALRRIEIVKVFDVFKMMDALQDLRNNFPNEVAGACAPLKVLIVDSIPAVIAPVLGSKHAEGLSLMTQIARELKSLAKDLSIAVLPIRISKDFDLEDCGFMEEHPTDTDAGR